MGIQDTYFDIVSDLENGSASENTLKLFDDFSTWAFQLEDKNQNLLNRVYELETAIKMITELQERK